MQNEASLEKLTELLAQLKGANSSDDVLRVCFLIHCELKDIVTNLGESPSHS